MTDWSGWNSSEYEMRKGSELSYSEGEIKKYSLPSTFWEIAEQFNFHSVSSLSQGLRRAHEIFLRSALLKKTKSLEFSPLWLALATRSTALALLGVSFLLPAAGRRCRHMKKREFRRKSDISGRAPCNAGRMREGGDHPGRGVLRSRGGSLQVCARRGGEENT